MTRLRSVFGRPVPRLSTRRIALLLAGLSILALACISLLTSAVPAPPRLSVADHIVSIPHIQDTISNSRLNPFRQPSHPPPRQKDDSFGGSSWWADWKWLSVPFSSSLTLDDDRALLPPLDQRTPIYCYYDAATKKPADEKDAESAILLSWRRAWWAQGFRPVILSASEATNNPMHLEIMKLRMDDELRTDLLRWLAWDTMEGGLLAHYTLFPMASRDNALLEFLRRGEFPNLTRWQELDDGLLVGAKADVHAALHFLLQAPSVLEGKKDVLSAVPEGTVAVDKVPDAIAYYSAQVIKQKYPRVEEQASRSRAKGLWSLNTLINSHLHDAWQARFPQGIEVLKPLPEHSSTMINEAVKFARLLTMCFSSPMPASCPPNNHRCTPCVSRSPMVVRTPKTFHNSTSIYTIGVVPHPWTMALLANVRESLDVAWIRQSPREAWLRDVTQSLLGTGVSGSRRVMVFKETVAGRHATAYSLWFTAEAGMPPDMDWHFGFAMPQHALDSGMSESPVPADRLVKDRQKPQVENGHVATEQEVELEQPLLDRAREVVAQTKPTLETKMRSSLEAWNLAHAEAWKFTRAFQARRAMEREAWEKQETKYSAGAGFQKGRSAWNRWQDRKEGEET